MTVNYATEMIIKWWQLQESASVRLCYR